MITIPVTIIDNFLDNPDLWVDIANTCNYKPATSGNWPGVRSEPLEKLVPEAFDKLCSKFFSIFYNLKIEPINWKVTARFQKISNNMEAGWVHYDKDIISGIIYLNKDSNIGAGTAIYSPNNLLGTIHTDKKINFFKGIEPNIAKYREDNNNNFTETIRISNIYNRLVAFDSNIPHRALDYNTKEDRLTLVFFIEKLFCENTPISRSKRL